MVRITTTTPKEDKPATETPPKQPTPHWRRFRQILLVLLAAACFGGGWFAYRVAAASNKIFTANTTGGSPLLHGKKLPDTQIGRINILLIGVGGPGHDGPNLADTIQVASVDPKTKQVAMLSLPRDLYVQVPDSYQKVKINEVHSIGEDQGAKGGGPGLLKQEVSDIIGQPIHYFVRVDFDGFKQMVDSVNGVDLNVKERLYDPYYPRGESAGYEVLDVEPGTQHMNGTKALKYARSRETTTDFDRSRRQQEVMVGVREKALSLNYLSNPAKITQLIDIAGDHVKTDLLISEMEKLGRIIQDIQPTSVQSKVLDNTNYLYDSAGAGGAYILVPRGGNYTDIRAFVEQYFNGGAITSEAAHIELVNASGRNGLAKQETDLLAGFGYNIVNATTAPELAQTTAIYDYTNGQKSATAAALAKRYNTKVIKQARAAGDTVDLRVIIGTDYLNSGTDTNQSPGNHG